MIGLKEIRFRILDSLARGLGRHSSIQDIARSIREAKKAGFYKNVYEEIIKLHAENFVVLKRAGKARLASLNFDCSGIAAALSEMEEKRKQEFFARLNNPEIERELNWLFIHTRGIAESICLIKDQRSLALRKLDLLFILRSPLPGFKKQRDEFTAGQNLSENEVEEERASLYKPVKWFAQRTNYQTSFLALTFEEFESLINSPKQNYLKQLARNEIAVFGAQTYWLLFALMRYQGRLALPVNEDRAEPDKLTLEEARDAFSRYGYEESRSSPRASAQSIESAIAKTLVAKEPRLLEAIPIVLAKDAKREINYPLLEYLAEKYGNSILYGFLLSTALKLTSLRENGRARSSLERLARQHEIKSPDEPSSWRPVNLRLNVEDISKKMRAYNAY